MLGGSWYYNADRLKRKEFTDLIAKRKAQEKREAWIRELEARDMEDKEWREKLGKVRDAKREEAEKGALEEIRRRDAKNNDDGRGVIETVKGKLRDAKELEAARQTAEQEPDLAAMARQRRWRRSRRWRRESSRWRQRRLVTVNRDRYGGKAEEVYLAGNESRSCLMRQRMNRRRPINQKRNRKTSSCILYEHHMGSFGTVFRTGIK